MTRLQNEDYDFLKSTLMDNFFKLAQVDLLTGEYRFLKYDTAVETEEDDFEQCPSIYDYIEQQFLRNLILSDYAPEYLKYANPDYVKKRIFRNGDRWLTQNYKQRTKLGEIWVTFGIVAPKYVSLEEPQAMFYWQRSNSFTTTMTDVISTLSAVYFKILKINLTNDTFQTLKADVQERRHFSKRLHQISEWWARFVDEGYVHPDDERVFRDFTDLARLRKAFREHGGGMQSCRYRRKLRDNWRWVEMDLVPSMEYSNDNQVLLLFAKDVHDEFLKERRNLDALLDEYHRDALTRLYNRHKYDEDIEEISKAASHNRLTVGYVDVNGLHELNNKLGHDRGDNMLCSVADALKKYFPEDSVYRIGGDEFVVFSQHLSREGMEHLMGKVRAELAKDNYDISVGVESGGREMPIHKIVRMAEIAMREDKELYYRLHKNRKKLRGINEELERNLQKEKNTERFLDFISNNYNAVFFVNLKQDTSQYIYVPQFFLEMLEKEHYSYKRALLRYMNQYVRKEDHELFQKCLDHDYLSEQLRTEKLVTYHYQKIDGATIQLQIIKQNATMEACEDTIWIFQTMGKDV